MNQSARPVFGPILTRPFIAALAVFALCLLVLAWRFVAALRDLWQRRS